VPTRGHHNMLHQPAFNSHKSPPVGCLCKTLEGRRQRLRSAAWGLGFTRLFRVAAEALQGHRKRPSLGCCAPVEQPAVRSLQSARFYSTARAHTAGKWGGVSYVILFTSTRAHTHTHTARRFRSSICGGVGSVALTDGAFTSTRTHTSTPARLPNFTILWSKPSASPAETPPIT
jgi:hypothetical protein